MEYIPDSLEVPAEHQGYSQAGALETRPFATKTLAVQSRCRVVAVLGPNDYHCPGDAVGNAAPDNDGWFVSDFYLLHYLLRPASESQTWLSCMSPEYLVKKYQCYAQGNPKTSERRIVLDHDILPQTNITIVEPENLLERFLWAVKSESAEAARRDQTVVLIILGHGEPFTFRIALGGKGDQAITKHNQNRLDQSMISRSLHKSARATLVTTSCYSGGWTLSPLFNVNTLTAIDAFNESLSFSGATMGRLCGSPFVSAIVQALIRVTILDLGIESESNELQQLAWTFNALTHSVYQAYRTREGAPNTDPPQPMPTFAAGHDAWEQDFEKSGLSRIDYLGRWDMLRKVPAAEELGASVTGAIALPESTRYLPSTALRRILCHKATRYLNSFPGVPTGGLNVRITQDCRRLFDNVVEISDQKLQRIGQALDYRLYDVMARATIYKRVLNVEFVACEDFDCEAFIQQIQQRVPLVARMDVARKYQELLNMVHSKNLFDDPLPGEGWAYIKGQRYLAAIIFDQGWTHDEALARMTYLVENFRGTGYRVTFRID
jgi:hypothetical protein